MTGLRARCDGTIDYVHAAMTTYAPSLTFHRLLTPLLKRCPDGGWIIAHGRHPMKRVAHWCLTSEAIAGGGVE